MRSEQTIIVGGGLSGLSCASYLHKAGYPFVLLEASDELGGRVKSDTIDGYILDRGFQIFLTAYPEAKRLLDYESLHLRPFLPGALVRYKGSFHRLSDPWRRPLDSVQTFFSPIGNGADKLKIASTRARAQLMPLDELLEQKLEPTIAVLKKTGFSEKMVEAFLRPFLSGIFLEDELSTSRHVFDFVFRMLANGDNALPRDGMRSIPLQLAAALPEEKIRKSCRVAQVLKGGVKLDTGEIVSGSRVVLSTEEPVARCLLGIEGETRFNSTTTIYFAAPKPPYELPILVVNGESKGVLTNVSVQSNVAPSYAPEGQALIAANIVGDTQLSDSTLEQIVRDDLGAWFGEMVKSWKLLRIYRIKYALPDQSPEAIIERKKIQEKAGSIFVCGDYKETASINGALLAGRKTAESIIDMTASRSA